MPDDIFDIVDSSDTVVGSAPRSIVHRERLMHRAAHILIFCIGSGGKKILLQKRSMSKDLYPGRYTTSCSGHVDSGETYDEAAVRELREETGVVASASDMFKVGKIKACAQTGNEFTFVYEMEIPESTAFKFSPDEVESLEWADIADFESELSQNPEKFTPAFACVYEFYKASGHAGKQE